MRLAYTKIVTNERRCLTIYHISHIVHFRFYVHHLHQKGDFLMKKGSSKKIEVVIENTIKLPDAIVCPEYGTLDSRNADHRSRISLSGVKTEYGPQVIVHKLGSLFYLSFYFKNKDLENTYCHWFKFSPSFDFHLDRFRLLISGDRGYVKLELIHIESLELLFSCGKAGNEMFRGITIC